MLVAWAVGSWLTAHGVNVYAPVPPLYAGFAPHAGPGTVPALLVAVLVAVRGPELAGRLRWSPLLLVGYLTSVAWTVALALVDGWQAGIAGRLTTPTEYLHEVPDVTDVGALLHTFTDRILAFQPDSFTTHVAAHPPGALLLFVGLDRIGLGGGGVAGMVCILVGASAPLAVAVALRALRGDKGERWARAALPFGVLAPAAVWVGVSADGLFTGVLAWGVALLAAGSGDGGGWRARSLAFLSGLLLGGCLYLSYGLALAGLFPLAVFALTRRVEPLLVAAAGAGLVVAAFTVAGFWWLDGYQLTKVLYGQPAQLGTERPYGYWVWAAPIALAVAVGPAVVAGLRRLLVSVPVAVPNSVRIDSDGRVGLVALCGAALTAVLLADLSGLSRGEAERIWLPFAVWLVAAAGLLPARSARWWLFAQAAVALAVNHLLVPPW